MISTTVVSLGLLAVFSSLKASAAIGALFLFYPENHKK
jgi:hypothetical protein